VVHVVYPGKVEVEHGSPVIYEGVRIGEVESVVLRHADPTRRAQVEVTLEIDDPGIVLRDGDLFHLSHLRGAPIVEVSPTLDPSQPIASGARVAGVPPLVTRLEETLDAAIESIGNLAVEAIEKAFEDLELETLPPERAAPARPDADLLR
jgi:hypothetical protein